MLGCILPAGRGCLILIFTFLVTLHVSVIWGALVGGVQNPMWESRPRDGETGSIFGPRSFDDMQDQFDLLGSISCCSNSILVRLFWKLFGRFVLFCFVLLKSLKSCSVFMMSFFPPWTSWCLFYDLCSPCLPEIHWLLDSLLLFSSNFMSSQNLWSRSKNKPFQSVTA